MLEIRYRKLPSSNSTLVHGDAPARAGHLPDCRWRCSWRDAFSHCKGGVRQKNRNRDRGFGLKSRGMRASSHNGPRSAIQLLLPLIKQLFFFFFLNGRSFVHQLRERVQRKQATVSMDQTENNGEIRLLLQAVEGPSDCCY
ncbi:hypothetical protein BS78_07G040200 [Paspalum vaginatum]|nr:hypothetical protein BS78_07G040200 [Paspalum vaginatum]